MATIKASVVQSEREIQFSGVYRIEWKDVKAGDVCEQVALARWTDRSVQVTGTFGGATVDIVGTLNTVFDKLRDGEGLDLVAISDSRIKYVQEPTAFLKPLITGGDGTTNITITLMATNGGLA